jgi:hypothetical protein
VPYKPELEKTGSDREPQAHEQHQKDKRQPPHEIDNHSYDLFQKNTPLSSDKREIAFYLNRRVSSTPKCRQAWSVRHGFLSDCLRFSGFFVTYHRLSAFPPHSQVIRGAFHDKELSTFSRKSPIGFTIWTASGIFFITGTIQALSA